MGLIFHEIEREFFKPQLPHRFYIAIAFGSDGIAP
jgi:hypothetical protein